MFTTTIDLKHQDILYDVIEKKSKSSCISCVHNAEYSIKVFNCTTGQEEPDLFKIQEQVMREYKLCLDEHQEFLTQTKIFFKNWHEQDPDSEIVQLLRPKKEELQKRYLEIMDDFTLFTLKMIFSDLTEYTEDTPKYLRVPPQYDIYLK